MLVFGVGSALAGIAGGSPGLALVTQSDMAAALGLILFVVIVCGGLGSLPGAFIASLVIGLVQTFAVALNGSLASAFGSARSVDGPVRSHRHLERHDRPGRADRAVSAAGDHSDRTPHGPDGDTRDHERHDDFDTQTCRNVGRRRPAVLRRVAGRHRCADRAADDLLLRRLLTSFSLIGIAIVFALSYNILLGQTGLLSFGHAVHYGLGGFAACHMMNAVVSHGWPIPLPFIPLFGGLGGLAFAMIIGWVMTKRAGTVFSMISLGIAELVASSSLILRSVFGGESGISTDRTALPKMFGWTFGPQLQVYYLIAFWLVISAIAMYALTRTPLGRISNAVRDNPERVQFIGYDPHVVRYIAFCFAGVLCRRRGWAGCDQFRDRQLGLSRRDPIRPRAVLDLYRGRLPFSFGPILGAILVTYLQLRG